MLEQENNPEVLNTSDEGVVNQTEMEVTPVSNEDSIDSPVENNEPSVPQTETNGTIIEPDTPNDLVTNELVPERSDESADEEINLETIESESVEAFSQHKTAFTNDIDTQEPNENVVNEFSLEAEPVDEKSLAIGEETTYGHDETTDGIADITEDAINMSSRVGDMSEAALPPLHTEEEDEDEETKMIDEEDSINLDYSAYTKDQLLTLACEAPKILAPREAVKRIQNIRPFFDDLLKRERQEKLLKYVEAGNEEDTFEFTDDDAKLKFYDAFKMAQEARAEEKKRTEDEKLKNLATKEAIIDRIKVLTESDETVDSLNEIKKLQNEWKAIRVVPKGNLQELYDRYHFYLDKFYDNFAINRELKELDRQKNLGVKIDLCNKASELHKEPSLKRAFILLSKYQEEFKNTGPVPKEFSEEIWSRFKSTIDEIYKQRKSQFDEIQEKRVENLKLKEVLVEKARLIANHIPSKGNEWKTNFDELNKLMEEWKIIGQVPKAQNEIIWQQFREQFNIFSKNRNEQFKRLNAERKANISIKEDICRRAEELKDNEDFNYATKELIKLQEEWKNSGTVPESVSQAVWKRFRKACDEFFNRKRDHFESRKGEETDNLNKKLAIIAELEALQTNENGDEVLAKLRELQSTWNQIGFVPLKNKKEIGDTFHDLLDIIYKKFRQNRDSYKSAHLKDHYNQISSQPGGDKKLGDDERRLREKIKAFKTEIETWENNMEFFAKSKNADIFKKDIEGKIAKVNQQIDTLNKELIALRAAKAEKA